MQTVLTEFAFVAISVDPEIGADAVAQAVDQLALIDVAVGKFDALSVGCGCHAADRNQEYLGEDVLQAEQVL